MAGYLRLLVFEAGEDDSYGQNFHHAVVIAVIAMSRAASTFEECRSKDDTWGW